MHVLDISDFSKPYFKRQHVPTKENVFCVVCLEHFGLGNSANVSGWWRHFYPGSAEGETWYTKKEEMTERSLPASGAKPGIEGDCPRSRLNGVICNVQ